MKGLEISRMFFEEWGLPYMREHFPLIEDKVAAGLFARSQSLHVLGSFWTQPCVSASI